MVKGLCNSLGRSVGKDLLYRLVVGFELLLVVVVVYVCDVLELGHLYVVYPLGVKSSSWFEFERLSKASYVYIAIPESLANVLSLCLVYFLTRRLLALPFYYLPSLVVLIFGVAYLLGVRFDDVGVVKPIL